MMERAVTVLWYALYKGELCRLRRTPDGRLVSEAWRDGFWVKGPDFGERDFTGRSISPEEADAWIRARFKKKLIGRSPQRQLP
jgi:hypothetical protein